MRESPFFFEIKDIMTQFVSAFNDIIIKRHDKHKNPMSRVKVRYVYAPKQRVVHDLTNKARHLTLPVVAVNISGISRDNDRVFNKIEGSYYMPHEINKNAINTSSKTTSTHMLQPVPIDITVNMSILARYQTDIEQIISNFVPYSDPYIVISWKVPEGFTEMEQEIRSEVIWNGDMSMDYPEDLGATEPFRLACDTTFTVKTWLFKKQTAPVDNIYKITANYSLKDDFSLLAPYHSNTERSYSETISPVLTAAPHITHVSGHDNKTILGYNLGETTNVYVSGSDMINPIQVQPFTKQNLSTEYPAFTAVPVPFTVNNDNSISVDLTDITHTTEDDLIIQNAGGYDSIKNPRIGGGDILEL